MLVIGQDEWDAAPWAGTTIHCPQCGAEHPIEHGVSVAADGTRSPDTLLRFYRCGTELYIASVNGRLWSAQ